jgi:hypothetical protein
MSVKTGQVQEGMTSDGGVYIDVAAAAPDSLGSVVADSGHANLPGVGHGISRLAEPISLSIVACGDLMVISFRSSSPTQLVLR